MNVGLGEALLYDGVLVDDDVRTRRIDLRAENDSALVSRAQGDDMGAFEELVRRYRNDVYGLAFHFIGQREDAWDLSQEVFIKAFRALKRFRGEAGFKTWLLRITVNRCKDHYKKRRLQTTPLEIGVPGEPVDRAVASSPDKALEARELGEAIQTALDGLPEKQRTAFVLREFEDMSYEEMAKAIGCSLGTVMSRLHHARKKLQQALSAMGVREGR